MGRRSAANRDQQQPLLDLEAPAPAPDGGNSGVARLFREAAPEACTISTATLFLLVGALSNLAVPRVAGSLVDAVTNAASGALTPAAARKLLDEQLLLVLAIILVGGLASGLRAYLFNSAAERVMCRLRVRLFSKLVLQDVGFFDFTPVGELSNRLAEDTRAIKDAATTSISMALRSAVTVVLGLVMLVITSWRLALLTCATLPITLAAFRIFARLNKRYAASQLTAAAAASATAQEALSGIRTVKSFAQEQHIIDKYTSAAQEILQWGLKSAVAGGMFVGTALPFAAGCMMVVFWYGAVLVLRGSMSIGDLNAFMLYAIFVAGSAGGLAGTAAQVVTAVGAGSRVFALMDRTPQLAPAGPLKPLGSPQGAALAFQAVCFSYPARPSSPVLQGFSLELQPGQTIALVGPSGGGKSTVVKLVQRFYDPEQGAVLLNGVDLRQIDASFLHQQVALVAQEPLVFAESIEYNLRFGLHNKEAVTQEDVEAAAKAAHAHEFIVRLPQGYQTRVGEQGVTLSGGQRQRLAIARALLTQPRLLLLDEATSALDAESEHLVQQALQEAARHRSVMVIAHRLSTVTHADVVAVVQSGRVVEQGAHSDLLAEGGAYSQLVQRQVVFGSSAGADADQEEEEALTVMTGSSRDGESSGIVVDN